MSTVSMRYDINIVFAFVAVGVILLLAGDGSPLWGYTWLSLSLMGLLFTIISQLIINSNNKKQPIEEGWLGLARIVWSYSISTLPVSLMFILVTWYSSQYFQYQDIIERGNLPQEYYAFNNISIILLVFELIALYNVVSTTMKEDSMTSLPSSSKVNTKKTFLEHIQTKDETIYYGFILFNFIMAGFMNVILKCFITDG